jgi:cell division protein FtsB
VSENGEFAVGTYKAFEAVLALHEAVITGLSRKERQLLAEVRRLKDENGRLRAELEARALEGQIK